MQSEESEVQNPHEASILLNTSKIMYRQKRIGAEQTQDLHGCQQVINREHVI